MLEIEKIIFPESLDEAAACLDDPESVVLGGCGYLRLGSRKIATAIDLSKLMLDTIVETGTQVQIGAMVCLRRLETDPVLQRTGLSVLGRAVESIVGVQLRNVVTLGGSVAGRYPFSDPITALLALDAELEFYKTGKIPLKDYLKGRGFRDILVHILLPKDAGRAAFTSVRKSRTDYAVLNCAVAQVKDAFRVVVGSRPGRARRVSEAEQYLQDHGLSADSAIEAGRLAGMHLKFGDNPRGSSTYRARICPVLVERALLEVHNAG